VPRLDLNPSYHGDKLQYAKQLIYISLPQMMKYCIMRECENILHGFLYDFDLAFVILKKITVLNSTKGFWRSLPEISLLLFSFGNPNHLKTKLSNLSAHSLSIRKAECLTSSSQRSSQHPLVAANAPSLPLIPS
jgi:hypothetical protein